MERDFGIYQTEIEHILEDLKISIQSELDHVYKVFILKYSEIKAEVQEMRKLRK